MPKRSKIDPTPQLTREWALPPAASLGSSVRCKGILNEIRSRLPLHARKSLTHVGTMLVLSMPADPSETFKATEAVVSNALSGIEALPIIPRELEDILTVSTTERHRWLKDGRLVSAGTRTVKLHGRAKKITFHVFDPSHVENILDRDLVSAWREDDVLAARARRSHAAATRALMRKAKTTPPAEPHFSGQEEEARPLLAGWEEFARENLLR
jgi:hypothetical protein